MKEKNEPLQVHSISLVFIYFFYVYFFIKMDFKIGMRMQKLRSLFTQLTQPVEHRTFKKAKKKKITVLFSTAHFHFERICNGK